jgi:hypothetical protein
MSKKKSVLKNTKRSIKMERICAWCNPEKKEKGISHGICKECREKMESPLWRWNPIKNKFEKIIINGIQPLTY